MQTLEETTIDSDYDEPAWKKAAQTSYSRKNCNHFLHEEQAEPNRKLFLELFDQDPDVECTIDDAIFKNDEENENDNKKKKNKQKDEDFFTKKYQRKLEKKKAKLQEIFENSSVYQNLQKLKSTPLNIQEVDLKGNVTKRYEYYYDYEKDKHDLIEINKDGFESPVLISSNAEFLKDKFNHKPVKNTNKRKRKIDENLNNDNENKKISKNINKRPINQERTLRNRNHNIEQLEDDENVIVKNKNLDILKQPTQKKMKSNSFVKNSSMIGLNRKEFNLTVDFSMIEKNESLIKNLDTTLVTSFLSTKQSKNLLNVFKSSAFSRNVEKESDCLLEETLSYQENLNKLYVSISESISSDHFTLEKLEGLSQKDKVLHFCKPKKISNFKTILKINKNHEIKKISEGSYGEVFSLNNQNKEEIIKIIKLPDDSIESACGAILPEILVSFALNDLQNKYRFSNFINLKKCSFVQDKYPKCLLDAWQEYDEIKESENEDPSTFDEKSQFVVLFLENGGSDLESYQKLKPSEALSIIKQIILSVALAEMSLKFEHRDLHLGNLLIKNTDEENFDYYIDDKKYSIKTCNLKVSIIDYSLTRFSKDGIVIYDDLNQYPEIFEGENDLQYDVYRKMKEINNGDWKSFMPKTNIVWLDFILKKLLKLIPTRVSKEEKANLNILKKLNKDLIEFDSCLNALELIESI